MVPEYDCSLLRFLWWTNHNISDTVENFEMKVHVLRSTSLPPGCCNYALKKTAVGNEKLSLRCCNDNDNLLKSVKDVQTAIRLMYEIKRMYASGDFKQAKKNGNTTQML